MSKESCNINKYEFLNKVEAVKHSRNDNCAQKTETNTKKLMKSLNEMCQNNNESYEYLEQGIIEAIFYISQEPLEFLKLNHVITFTLILLQHLKKCRSGVDNLPIGESLKDIFSKREGLTIGNLTIPKEVLRNVLDRLPNLKAEIEEKSLQINVTMYQLLEGYQNFYSKRVFKWRQKNESMPNFSSGYLIHKYGHKEKLTYINYLKESRPNMAYCILCQQGGKSSRNISSKM